MALGHNGGPSLSFTARIKLARIKDIVERTDLTAAQKCVGVGIVVAADVEWAATVNTSELQRIASAKDRETVFRATKVLQERQIIEKSSGRGQLGRYVVIPPQVVEAVIEAFEELQSGRVKPDGLSGGDPPEVVGLNQTAEVVEVVLFEPTSEPSRALACIESPSGINTSLEKINTPVVPMFEVAPQHPDAVAALRAYNETAERCDLPKATKLSKSRERAILSRLREYGFDGWMRGLANIEKSAFLLGQTHHKFRANLDFMCQAKSFDKLHDGGYGNGAHAVVPALKAAQEAQMDDAFERAREADEQWR